MYIRVHRYILSLHDGDGIPVNFDLSFQIIKNSNFLRRISQRAGVAEIMCIYVTRIAAVAEELIRRRRK